MSDKLPRHHLEDEITTVHKVRYRTPHPSAGKVNPNWHATFKFKNERPVGPKSLKTKNLEDAKRQAAKEARRLMFLYENDQPLRPSKFSDVAEGFLRVYKRECEREDRMETYHHAERTIRNHLVPWFGSRQLSAITPQQIINYRDQRISSGNRGGKPYARSTINKELMVLRKIFYRGRSLGLINEIPSIKGDNVKDNFTIRPAMTEDEWKTFNAYLRYWHEELGPHQTHQKFYREALRDWCQVIAYSGLRTGEASLLKWKDWKVIEGKDGREYCRLQVRGEEKRGRKTGARPVIAPHWLNDTLRRRRSKTDLTDPDDYIFAHIKRHRGKPIMRFNKTFKEALANCGLLYDSEGNERRGFTPYILRHTKATFDLALTKREIYQVAVNLGNQISTTEKFYSKATADDFIEELGSVDGFGFDNDKL